MEEYQYPIYVCMYNLCVYVLALGLPPGGAMCLDIINNYGAHVLPGRLLSPEGAGTQEDPHLHLRRANS
jgi:hypothetical protein